MNPVELNLPPYPKPGDRFSHPKDVSLGASHVIRLVKGSDILAHITTIAPVSNVSGKVRAHRLCSVAPLVTGDDYHLVVQELPVIELIFQDFLGWVPYRYGIPITTMDVLCYLEQLQGRIQTSKDHHVYETALFSIVDSTWSEGDSE